MDVRVMDGDGCGGGIQGALKDARREVASEKRRLRFGNMPVNFSLLATARHVKVNTSRAGGSHVRTV
jgi:hypothetical protein